MESASALTGAPPKSIYSGTAVVKKIDQLLSWFSELKKERQYYEEMWQYITDYVVPRRYNFKGLKQKGMVAGDMVFDGTAQAAHDILVSGFHGNMLSAQFPWVKIQIPSFGMNPFGRQTSMRKFNNKVDQIPEIKTYLEDYEWALYNEYQRSNFYDIMTEYIADASSIGTSTVFMEEDVVSMKTIYTVCNPGECYPSINRYGKVDALFRKFKKTVRQLKQEYKESDLPEYVRNDQTMETEYDIIHAVYPRSVVEMYQSGRNLVPKIDAKNMPWASVTMLEKRKEILKESGYRQFPYACWRWRVNSEETYGRSPSSDAIVTIIGGNIMAKSLLQVAELMANPPWNIPSELRGQERIVPRGRNYFEDHNRIVSPITVGNNYPIGKDREDEVRKIIKDFYHVDFFMMLSRAAMEGRQLSVPQVMEMQGEKASVLGTIIGRFASDGLDVINDRTADLADEGGRMPPMPEILMDLFGGSQIRYDYIGPLAQMQKRLFRTSGIMQGLKIIGEMNQIDPTSPERPSDWVKMDYAGKELLESFGWPAAGFNDEKTVKETRKARSEAIAKDAQVKQAVMMSQAIPNVSKQADPNSPLAAMLNQQQ